MKIPVGIHRDFHFQEASARPPVPLIARFRLSCVPRYG
jgi:hypothetical protein